MNVTTPPASPSAGSVSPDFACSLQELALALICRPDRIGLERIQSLSEADWDQILFWAEEHRFGPCLLHSLGQAGLRTNLPGKALGVLEQSYRAATFRSLAVQSEIVRIHQLLEVAGIDHLYLKGSYLAQFAYPEMGLRPMRDIDLLVSPDRALEAFHVLKDAGFLADPADNAHPEAFLTQSNHLPRLTTPRSNIAVEVHTRLTKSDRLTRAETSMEFAALFARSISRDVGGCRTRFTGASDLLVHLCLHAVYEHQFNNGPLTLCDIRWLLATTQIDWPHVWRLAGEQGATRGVVLALKLTQREWPDLAIDFLGADACIGPADAEVLPLAARLMMRSFADRRDVALLERVASADTVSRLTFLWRRLFPSASEMALQYPLRPGSPLLYVYHVRRWLRLMGTRLPSIMRRAGVERVEAEVDQLRSLNKWLQQK
jgi:hypothetical protein